MKRRVVGIDLALTVAAQLAYKLLGFAILTLLARNLDPDEFGFLMFALATCELAALATEFGSSAHLTREVAVAPRHAPGLLGEVLGVRLALGSAYLVLMVAVAATLPYGQGGTFLAIAVYAGLKELSRAYSAVFYGARRVALAAGPFASHLGVLAVGIWLAIGVGSGTGAVAAAYLAAGIWLFGLSSGLARQIGPVRPSMRTWRRVIAASLPLFGLGLLTMIQLRIDASLLGLMRPYSDVANYAASARLFEASQSIVRPISLVFLPIAVGLATAGAYPELRRSLTRLAALAFGVGTATALAVAIVADQAIGIIFGAAYAPAAQVLRIHFAATPFVFVSAVALFHVTALRRERAALACGAASVALNVALDLLLIPSAGATGAAVATLAAEGLMAVSLLTLACRILAKAIAPTRPEDPHAAPLALG
jgi:O-antigen/teichoic acid export membrane protein